MKMCDNKIPNMHLNRSDKDEKKSPHAGRVEKINNREFIHNSLLRLGSLPEKKEDE